MIPPHNSLVRYENPILVSSGKGAKSAAAKAGAAGKKETPGKSTLTPTEDILNSILPPRFVSLFFLPAAAIRLVLLPFAASLSNSHFFIPPFFLFLVAEIGVCVHFTSRASFDAQRVDRGRQIVGPICVFDARHAS
jgi:hypothetical protein